MGWAEDNVFHTYRLVQFSGSTIIPANVHLLQLPPYCPELNPVEHLWDYTREKACANRYFENLNDVVEKVEHERGKLAQGTLTMVNKVSQMFCWPWMISAI